MADITIRRRGPPLSETAHAYMDSGYQRYQDDHAAIDIPYKKPKKGKLSKEEKQYDLSPKFSPSACRVLFGL